MFILNCKRDTSVYNKSSNSRADCKIQPSSSTWEREDYWSRALAALVADLGLVPRSHMMTHSRPLL